MNKKITICLRLIILVIFSFILADVSIDRSLASPIKTQDFTLIASQTNNDSTPKESYSGASLWAKPELDKAVKYNLIPKTISDKMNSPITREEFAELAIRLYEVCTGEKTGAIFPNPFNDCNNTEVLKAYKLGIVSGVASDRFEPESLINREQIAVMLYRTTKLLKPEADYSVVGAPTFDDENQVSDWALENVKYMAKSGYISGVGNNIFSPKDTATCE